ncbi:MAG TPA: FAD-dependent monooxygenase, partial [Mesotoga sp.]|nr:FAD-dependent monooxygenase [Mesotoga sp.]
MTRTVTVVGAGPAGLAAARVLGREGVDFTLIDS